MGNSASELKSLKSKVTALETKTKDYATLKTQVADASSNLAKSVDYEALAKKITDVSSYNDKVAEINSNTSLSKTEKLVQLQQLDKSLLNSIDEVSASISTSLQQNPANVSLAKKIADLSIVKSEIQEKVLRLSKVGPVETIGWEN